MIYIVTCLLCSVAVSSFKIVSKTDPIEEAESIASSSNPLNFQRRVEIDSPFADHTTYEAVFAGIKQPISVDCTRPGVICKFPLVVAEEESIPSKPAKVRAVPVVRGVDTPKGNSKNEGRDSTEKEELVSFKSSDENGGRVPVYKGSLDVEAVVADEKDIEDTWMLEKNILNKKYQIPVKLIPSKHSHGHGIAPVYPVHHDFHDHYNGAHPYGFPDRHGQGWTPWTRAYPSVYNYPSNQPCNPPVYHHPPPCSSSVVPTRKPTINIDDKVDKDED